MILHAIPWKTILLIIIIALGMALPEEKVIPVQGATHKDWNPKTFWFEPWGDSVTHKGIDIFGSHHTPVLASTHQLIIRRGKNKNGGNFIIALGPKWRVHYYAHLNGYINSNKRIVSPGTPIATVGKTGNAVDRPPHLHYSITSLVPYPWLADESTQGYKKAFILSPVIFFRGVKNNH